jgi:hypothetical protein
MRLRSMASAVALVLNCKVEWSFTNLSNRTRVQDVAGWSARVGICSAGGVVRSLYWTQTDSEFFMGSL